MLAIIDFAPDSDTTLGHHLAAPDAPHLSVADLSATRGDGIFETASLVNGHVQALDAHLERFAGSAAMLELPAPDLAAWRAAVLDVAEHLTRAGVVEGSIKFVLSRGVEGARTPTGWVWGIDSPDFTRERTEGIRVVLLDRGYRHDVARTSPWLLAGAKTLSYAVNRAAQREAVRRGADDLVFVSSDGFLLEGAVSSLLIRRGSHLITPRVDLGILAGTTQADLYAWAESAGYTTSYEVLTPADLLAADAAWLVSSVRHVAPIRSVDGTELRTDPLLSEQLNAALHARTR